MSEVAENVKDVHDESEWETVHTESGAPITFDVGTQFVGTFQGIDHIIPPNAKTEKEIAEQAFDQAKFTDADGNTRTINLGYVLAEAFGEVEPGSKVRITRMKDVPSNDPKKNDMKDYRVEVAK